MGSTIKISGFYLFPHPDEALKFIEELRNVLEFQINRGEADIGDLIEIFETAHDHLADFGGVSFTFRGRLDIGFDGVDDRLQFAGGDGALFASAEESGHDLVAVERFPASVFLNYHVRDFIDSFIAREAAFAFQAFSAPANGVPFSRFTRVDYFVFYMTAKRALHLFNPPLARGKRREQLAVNQRFSGKALL
jgi:hypothetical protein